LPSRIEHAAKCALETDPDIDHLPDSPDLPDFGTLFLDQEAEEEDAADLGEVLDALERSCCGKGYCKASDVAELINTRGPTEAAGHPLVPVGGAAGRVLPLWHTSSAKLSC
jgi:hypothetical protein